MFAGFSVDSPATRTAARTRKRIGGALIGFGSALPLALWLRGFMVDDALITARVATHIVRGLGPRFNPHGPIVDAVTPLGYAQVLSLFGAPDVLATFHIAKWLGLAAWLTAAAVLGALISEAGSKSRRYVPLALVALSAPLAAWSASGMETGLVTAFATLGLLNGPEAALALGLAAAWRPELIPFAVTLTAARGLGARLSFRRALVDGLLMVCPVVCVALLREHCFSRLVPLSFYAKPSDFEHGLRYALGATVFTGLPWLLLAGPKTLRRLPPQARAMLWALGAQFFAIVLCGGDWMPLYRLMTPVLPCVALCAAFIAEHSSMRAVCLRGLPALGFALILLVELGPPARRSGREREALITEARTALAGEPRIATLDVGWVGAATDAEVIDLAGVTDAEAAFFPGGHTSKRIPRAWLVARAPSAIVLLLARGAAPRPLEPLRLARVVEARVANLFADDYRVRQTLKLGDQRYVVLEPDSP